MGCGLFKAKPKEGEEASNVDDSISNQKEKKPKSAKEANKARKDSKKSNEGENVITSEVKNGKTGPNSAKVRPMSPGVPQNIPKPVAFHIDLEGQQQPSEITVTDGSNTDGNNAVNGKRLRLPRKLPKLSSLGRGNSTLGSSSSSGDQPPAFTNEDIMEKQRKAEEKRQEMLEAKKQKARKFVEKFGNNTKDANGEEDEDGEDELSRGMSGLDSGLGLDGYGLDGENGLEADGSKQQVVVHADK